MIKKATIEAIAKELRVSAGAVYAIVTTESSGTFSWGDGKIPILFERHQCYKYAKKKFGLVKARALAKQYPDICNPKRGGYGPSNNQYNRLVKAIRVIDEEVAHLATSFGAFQIMGFNHQLAGFPTAKAMSDAFHGSKDAQIQGFMSFIKNYKRGKVLDALRRKDWASAAYHYNGSAYKENRYDAKMKTASYAYNTGNVKLA